MLELSSSKRNELLSRLQKDVSKIEDSTLRNWSVGYLDKHMYRYQSDLDLLSKNYIDGKILELGSLPCHMTYMLHELALPYVGVDLNPSRAKSFIEDNQLDVIQCDIEQESVPFGESSFSLILMCETFEHLRINPLHTLREIKRMLQPEGKLILTTPNLYSLRNRWRFFAGKGLGDPVKAFQKLETMGHMGHLREYSKQEVARFIQTAGLRVEDHSFISYKRAGFVIGILYKLFPKLRPYQIFIVGK